MKLNKITIHTPELLGGGKHLFNWIHWNTKEFIGVGGVRVTAIGKRCLPTCMKLRQTGKLVP
eukprot:1246338-Karenia_brevis.AAC.1